MNQLRSLATPLAIIGILLAVWYSERITATPVLPGPIHIAYWEKWTDFEGQAMRDVVDAYNRKQNRIHVDLLTVSSIDRKTLLAIAGDDPPDVAGMYGWALSEYADDNAMIPLDDYCRKFGISRDQYVPVFWDISAYKGHVWALPTTPATTALHYSKAMFRAAGLDPEKPPTTFEEMDAAAAKLTTRDASGKIDKAGFLPAEPGWWNWSWGYFFGGRLWDGKSKITANSPENIRGFEWVQSWSKRYGAGELQTFRSGFGNFSSPQNAFLSGKVGMELQGVWMYNFIDKFAPQLEKPKLDWAAVPFPHPADRPDLAGAAIADLDVLLIPRGAKHPDEAFDFIRYVESQEGMEKLCLGQRKNSPLRKVSENFYKNHPNPYIRLFTDAASSPNIFAAPQLGIWAEYQAELNNAFDSVVLLKQSPKQALDYVQARMQPKLEQYLARRRQREASEGAATAMQTPPSPRVPRSPSSLAALGGRSEISRSGGAK